VSQRRRKITTTPDATAIVVVNGPSDDALQASGSYGVARSDLNGLLEPSAVKVARRILRRARAQQSAWAYPPDMAVSERLLIGSRLIGRRSLVATPASP
jgi:hypothetical protein